MSTSRGFKGNSQRISQNFYQNNIALRNHNGYDQKHNYNTSRQYTSGIFTNELNKQKKIPSSQQKQDFQIQIVQILPQNQPKLKSGNKAYGYRQSQNYRQSTDYRQSQNYQQYDININLSKTISKQIQTLRNQIYFTMFSTFQQHKSSYTTSLEQIISQMNKVLSKRQESYHIIKMQTYNIKQQLMVLGNNFSKYSKDNDDKMQGLVNQIGNGMKRSKIGEYGVDIKSSFQGMSSSISNNYNQGNNNSKLLNQAMFQLDTLKRQLLQTQMNVQQLSLKLTNSNQTKPHQTQTQSSSLSKQQITHLITRHLKQDKHNSKTQQRLQSLDSKLYSINQILKQQEDNIIGMNEQLKNIINNQTNPKIKKIEGSIVDIYSKIDRQVMQMQMKRVFQQSLGEKLKGSRVLRVRSNNKVVEGLNSINGCGQDKISFRETYLMDDQNYLMDSQGNYLVEEVNGLKKRIKIEENLIYLMKLKGIQIINCQ